MNISRNRKLYILICIAISAILLYVSLVGKDNSSENGEPIIDTKEKTEEPIDIDQKIEEDLKTKDLKYKVEIEDEGIYLSYYGNVGYRYGPSIMNNDDGSMDIWFSAPGNNSTEWDYITYMHSDDKQNFSAEQTVLRPTPGSSDKCSVCDPGLIYFNGYYYLGYTSTYDSTRNGYNNSAFVARSENPNGPFEKWNGSSWGGSPEPIIKYEGNPDGWGIGEISFVIKDEDLYIYYTYFDENGGYTGLQKADLVDDWPLTMRFKDKVCLRANQDSLDVAYVEELDTFWAFSIDLRMHEGSKLVMYESKNGKNFEQVEWTKSFLEPYAHNVGISKDYEGHISVEDDLYISYGFGQGWGKWSSKLQKINVSYTFE